MPNKKEVLIENSRSNIIYLLENAHEDNLSELEIKQLNKALQDLANI